MTPEEYLHERHLLQLERFPHCVPLPGVMVMCQHFDPRESILWTRTRTNHQEPSVQKSLIAFDQAFEGTQDPNRCKHPKP